MTLLINTAKHYYYTRMTKKLDSPQRSSKAYRSLLKNFLNDKRIKINATLYHKDEFVTDFNGKIELNSFLANQCYLIKNNTTILNKLKYLT